MGIKGEAMSEDTEERVTPRKGGTAPTMNLPSVTECLKPFMNFSKVPLDVLAAAAARGTEVHSLIALYLSNLWIPGVPENCQGFFDSFLLWADSFIETVHMVEPELKDEVLKFQGHPDAVITIYGDKSPLVCDWKTPLAHNSLWFGQIAAYRHLIEKNTDFKIKRGLCIRLKKDGSMPTVNECTHLHQYFNAFLGALNAYRMFG